LENNIVYYPQQKHYQAKRSCQSEGTGKSGGTMLSRPAPALKRRSKYSSPGTLEIGARKNATFPDHAERMRDISGHLIQSTFIYRRDKKTAEKKRIFIRAIISR
jgi:hypothetical protein